MEAILVLDSDSWHNHTYGSPYRDVQCDFAFTTASDDDDDIVKVEGQTDSEYSK